MPTKDFQFDERLAKASDVDWARLAAYIDGEGTIYINRQRGKGRVSPRHFLCLSVTNTSPVLMAWLVEHFGGTVYAVKPNGFGRKPIMRWQMNETRALRLLQGCVPYLVVKKAQGEVGVAFARLKINSNRSRLRLTAEVVNEREAARTRIKELNGFQIVSTGAKRVG